METGVEEGYAKLDALVAEAADGQPRPTAPAHRRCVTVGRSRVPLRRRGMILRRRRAGWRARRRPPPRGVVPGFPPGSHSDHASGGAVGRPRPRRRLAPRPTPCRHCSTTGPPPSASTVPASRHDAARAGDRHDLHRRRVPPPLGSRQGHRPGRDARPGKCAEMLEGMLPMDEALRQSGHYGPQCRGPRRRRHPDQVAGVHRPHAIRRVGHGNVTSSWAGSGDASLRYAVAHTDGSEGFRCAGWAGFAARPERHDGGGPRGRGFGPPPR